jgi:hypothetical protein
VREQERTGTISILKFYGRRMRRIMPAAALVLIATVAAGWWPCRCSPPARCWPAVRSSRDHARHVLSAQADPVGRALVVLPLSLALALAHDSLEAPRPRPDPDHPRASRARLDRAVGGHVLPGREPDPEHAVPAPARAGQCGREDQDSARRAVRAGRRRDRRRLRRALHTAFSAFVVGVCWSSMLCCSVQAWAYVAGVVQLLCVPFSAQSTKSGLASDRIKLS